jgi:hypothetical protein
MPGGGHPSHQGRLHASSSLARMSAMRMQETSRADTQRSVCRPCRRRIPRRQARSIVSPQTAAHWPNAYQWSVGTTTVARSPRNAEARSRRASQVLVLLREIWLRGQALGYEPHNLTCRSLGLNRGTDELQNATQCNSPYDTKRFCTDSAAVTSARCSIRPPKTLVTSSSFAF